MDNVVSLNGGNILHGPGNPNEVLVEDLERLLQMAKDGEVVAAMTVAEHADGCTSLKGCRPGTFHAIYSIVGQLHRASAELLRYANDRDNT